MKQTSVKRRLIKGALVVLFITSAPALLRAEDPALAQAEKLLDAREFDAAITEFKRFIFFNGGLPDIPRVEARIAACYRDLGQWRDAIAWYERSSAEASDEKERADVEVASAAVEIAAGSYNAAEFRLLGLRRFASPDAREGRDALYLGIAYLLADRPEEAYRELSAYGQFLPAAQQEALAGALARSRSVPRRSSQTAKLLSTFLPGAGQMYVGNVLDGLNSLLVNGAAATLVVWAIVTGSYAEAALAFTYLFERYYAGNRANAEQQASAYNAGLNRQFAQAILAAVDEE